MSSRFAFRCFLRVALTVGMSAVVALAREERFAISATTAPHYDRSNPGQPGLREETYTFMEGRFFGGNQRSDALAGMTFDQIVRTLAVDLAKQAYRPVPDPKDADLLLVVHWGVTDFFQNPADAVVEMDRLNSALAAAVAAGEAGELPDVGPLNAQLAEQETTALSQQAVVGRNARLLGYSAELTRASKRLIPSADELTMRSELADARYFVVIMAYDYRLLREEKRSEVLWITRISVSDRGSNFQEALPALSQVGGDFFGQNQPGLQRVRAPIGEGAGRRATTEIGEVRVVNEPLP